MNWHKFRSQAAGLTVILQTYFYIMSDFHSNNYFTQQEKCVEVLPALNLQGTDKCLVCLWLQYVAL